MIRIEKERCTGCGICIRKCPFGALKMEEGVPVVSDSCLGCNALSLIHICGNQQRVVLGKWIARNMDVLILNGPTVGVDIGSKYDIHQVMKELADEGMGILMISDDLPEVLAVSNRGIVIKNGRIAGSFETDGTTTEMLDEMIGV